MKHINNTLYCIFFSICIWSGSATASDLEKEKRWSEQIVDSLLVGESVELKAGETPFLGVFAEAGNGSTGRAVILAHGIGAHPDWPEVIHPLRSRLPDHGWSTLSIQMPILANDAPLSDYAPLFEEVAPRIDAAIDYLRQQGNQTIVLIGHSLGASMAAAYLAGKPQTGINGFIAIGMGVIDLDDKMNSALALEKIGLPVLDLFGSRDLDSVRDTAKQRAKAARKGENAAYQQIEIEGANHFFVGVEDTLVRRVYGWLKARFETERGNKA